MSMQDELEKIDFFKRTKFKGFATGLSKPKPAKKNLKQEDEQS
tara:strand:+ start:414 stop:542 length:129 start_codon:yes stop_codon:yes gene_type:complete